MIKPKWFTLIPLFLLLSLSSSAREKIDSLTKALKMSDSELARMDICVALSKAYKRENLEKSLLYANQVLDIATKIENKEGIAQAHFLIGEVNVKQYHYDLTIEHSSKSLELATELKDSVLMLKCLYNLGISCFDLGRHHEALEYLLRGAAICKLRPPDWMLGTILLEIGTLLSEMGEYDKSIEYQLEALEVYKKENRLSAIIKCYNNLGVNYISKKEYDKAMEYQNKCQEGWRELGEWDMITYSYVNIGLIFSYQSQEDSAIWYYDLALRNANVEDKVLMERIYRLNGMSLIELARYDEAIASLHQSRVIAGEIESLVSVHQAHESLAEAFKRKGNLDSAFYHFSEFSRLRDTILRDEMTQESIRMEAAYSANEKKNELALKNKQLQLAQQEKQLLQYRRNLIIVIAISILLLVLILYSRQRIRFKKEKEIQEARLQIEELSRKDLERDILYKNKQLVSYALQLEQKNDMLREIKERLGTIEENLNEKEDNHKINQLNNYIDFISNSEKEWEEFSTYYEQVHQDFFSRLKVIHPYLTNKELRLCALLNINLSTKEIANILHLSPKSVEIARYRLRKKLGLQREDNLVDFIIKNTA